MTLAAAILWGHACAALLFAGLAAARVRDADSRLPRNSFVTACGLTALWALAAAGIDSHDVTTRIIESARNIAWFAFLYALLGRPGWPARATFAALTLLCVATAAVAVLEAALGAGEFGAARLAMRLVAVVAGLALVARLLAAAPAGQGGLRLALLALAGMWSVELIGFASALAAGGWPAPLVGLRGAAMVGVAVLLGIASQRGGDWTLRLSRGLAFRALAVAAVAAYAIVVALAIQVLGGQARLVQAAFVAGATALLIAAFASSWLRAWLKVKVAKHLFDHRYDYRAEWLRFTATLGRPGAPAPRIAQAMADLTDSPAALLLSMEEDGLAPRGGWNWRGAEGEVAPDFAAALEEHDWILDLDALRGEGATLPAWLVADPAAWVLVPLLHLDRLVGAVVLARPPVARALDWEDFDLLRTAGRQAASYLAEDRAAAALGEAQRFDEFNRRFAFIVHDVKNLVSQLGLTARNAERHADNPAFRADMIATLQDSCGRMSGLLTRLSQQPARAERLRPTDLAASAARLAAARAGLHPVIVTGSGVALVDPARFEQALGHLVQNAIEASPAGIPVALAIATTGERVTIAVTDRGTGMDPAFVRDELFRPFASSKPGGFGIGAFEARQLVRAMHGTLAVASLPGGGTTFTLAFPAAPAFEEAA